MLLRSIWSHLCSPLNASIYISEAQLHKLSDRNNDEVSKARDPDDVNRIGYLHDGRARTIDEAIRWHGGEANNAKVAYEDLSEQEKADILAFLESL